ncbi:hypothetical protein ACXN5S_15480 [Pseudoroseicyclus sp. H15]
MLSRLPFSVKRRGARPRLWFVTTADHAYTSGDFPARTAELGAEMVALSWEELFARKWLEGGSYLFTDFDRLSPSELKAAGLIAGKLKGAGSQVTNDARRFLRREQLIARLAERRLNTYLCWRPAAGEWPTRYPVFLRSSSGHMAPNRKLLHDEAEARARVSERLRRGDVLSDLILVEYRGEPIMGTEGFRRYSAYRLRDRIIRANSVHQDHWVVKGGMTGLASPEDYAAELREMSDFPQEAEVRRVFEVAGMEFGRLDFGLAGGRVETWEINTNPDMTLTAEHDDPSRVQTMILLREGLAQALAGLALPASGRVDIADAYPRSRVNPGRPLRI